MRRRKVALVLVTVCGMVAGCTGDAANTLEAFPQRLITTERSELVFVDVEPLDVEAEYMWLDEQGAFVAKLVQRDGARCFDILAATPDVERLLLQFDYYPDVIYDPPAPPTARFRLTIDAVAEVAASRASYQRWAGSDEILISSSAWYMQNGQQIFLHCPQRSPIAWRVYRVAGIELRDHSPAE